MNTKTEQRLVIVVALDFSESSQLAMQAAARTASNSSSAEVHLVHVLPAVSDVQALGSYASTLKVAMQTHTDQALARLEAITKDAGLVAGRTYHHVRIGDAAREVVQLASDVGADLVVVGTHGRTGMDRFLLGSVAERVVRTAPCQVLTVRPKAIAAGVSIAPPCPECVAVREQSQRGRLWCDRHAAHHPRAHTYHDAPEGFGLGAQSFRGSATR